MSEPAGSPEPLSLWWRVTTLLVFGVGFAILIWLTARAGDDAPPIPDRVVGSDGATLFGRDDILAGQQVFLRHGLMENGSIWGHGAYLGPDFSADYLHGLVEAVHVSGTSEAGTLLKQNRFDPKTRVLTFTAPEAAAFELQRRGWERYFSSPKSSRGLPSKMVSDPTEIRQLTAFFAWTAWSSVANRPGLPYSYTSNFPYEPEAGNRPTADAVLWSALSLVTLLGGTALVLFAFGRFDFLGWKGQPGHAHPQLHPGRTTESQRITILLFVFASLLFLLQAALGGATAHYRADPASFFGVDLSTLLPSHLARTWHLQLAILWVATAFVAGGLFLAPALGGKEPGGQARGVKVLLAALVLVVGGSLAGEALGLSGRLGDLWFWFGHQGWEYLDLGRAWQVALVAGLLLWAFLLARGISPARKDPTKAEISTLFLLAALAIPLFYLPALFFGPRTHFTLVDTWRFWIIHLWVEGFFELFVTAMVAVIFFGLGLVSSVTARRVIYLDAILYMGGGIVGTGHHWYWTGQSSASMALAALFSALEVVPLTLLTLDAADFIRLGRTQCDVCGRSVSVPHGWTFRFLMAVGFWNFVGAGVFGFLINLPVVSFFEVGTVLTPNHAHTAMMGVFGMLAVALMVFAYRQVLGDDAWARVQPWVRLSFWGLNGGLLLMCLTSLFPGGVLQLRDVLLNGYWHARSAAFLDSPAMRSLEWIRLPADALFIGLGTAPLVVAGVVTLRELRRERSPSRRPSPPRAS
jgi:nitric oxide reductase subunit B